MALIECPECGKVVSQTAEACPNCGYAVKKHFDEIAAAEAAEKRKAESAVKRQQRNKVLKIVIPIVLIVGAIVAGFVINHTILSERMLFESEDEMYRYLTDAKCWELDNDYREEYFVFYTNDRYVRLSEKEYYNQGGKIRLNPKRGYFETLFQHGSADKKYIISKNGDIVSDNKEDYYKKRFFTPSALENGYNVLNIEILSKDVSDDKITINTKVTNTGKYSYALIKPEAVIHFSDGTDEITDISYLVHPDDKSNVYLEPNKSGTSEIVWRGDTKKVDSFSVHIAYFDVKGF